MIDPDGVERARAWESEADGEVATGYYLDTRSTSELLQKMRDEADQGCGDAFPTAHSKQQFVSILNRAIGSLEDPAQRSSDRTSTAIRVQLAVGITATQCLIGGPAVVGTKATFGAGRDAVIQGAESGSESDAKSDRVDQLQMIDPRSGATIDVGVDFDTGKRGIRGKKDGGADGSDDGSAIASYGTEPWKVTNKSRRGIGIMRRDPPQTPPCVGEIVCIAKQGRTSTIGLVRWLTVDETGIYRAGVEAIAKRADSVTLRAAEDEDNPGAARPALALPFFGADEKVATLAALPGTFSERGVLIVESPGTEVQVRIQMNSLIDATPSCERFTYRITDRDS